MERFLRACIAFAEDDYLLISGIQHFRFCRRQWALIHIENQWAENVRTVEGEALHRKAHDASARERRGDLLIARDMRVFSPRLGITGACDVVEFRRDHPDRIDPERFSAVSETLRSLLPLVAEEISLESLRGLEGTGATVYFSVFEDMILRDRVD